MNVYKTYQEAKMANIKYAIFEYQGSFGTDKDILDRFSIQSREMKECNPSDHCMTVEIFKKCGGKFSAGDLIINKEGEVIVVPMIAVDSSNQGRDTDNVCYVLNAKSLNEMVYVSDKGFAWRENHGSIPCDGELLVDVQHITICETYRACDVDWNNTDDICSWRPSIKNWTNEIKVKKEAQIETDNTNAQFESLSTDVMAQDNEAAEAKAVDEHAKSDFKRENRYLVFKRKDMVKHLGTKQLDDLNRLASLVHSGRCNEGKYPLECVVVESDWSIYDKVWSMVECEVKGKTNQTREEYTQVFGSIFDLKEQYDNNELYSKSKTNDKYYAITNQDALIQSFAEQTLYRKEEKEVTWQDEVCEFFNAYPNVLNSVEEIKAAITQIAVPDKDKPTVLQRNFIEMCHRIASITDKPEGL